MSLSDLARRLFHRPRGTEPANRRQFVRAAAYGGAAAIGGLLLPDEAWAATEQRARRFGIEPGTLVDAQGRPLDREPSFGDPFIGTIMTFGFNFNPRGWARCDGQLMQINQNTALFSLLGTMYGGDGQTTFALPDLRGRFAMHSGQGPGLSNRQQGERGGAETTTLLQSQLPSHAHALNAVAAAGTTDDPTGAVLARPASSIPQYASPGTTAAMSAAAVGATGGGQPVDRMPPYLVLNVCIALFGVFPSRD